MPKRNLTTARIRETRLQSAAAFMLRNAHDFTEWLMIGDPRTMARIRECIRRYPKPDARAALIETCIATHSKEDTHD